MKWHVIPKKYRVPRPMSGSSPPRRRLRIRLPPLAIPILIGCFLAIVRVAGPIDDLVLDAVVRLTETRAPPQRTVVVRVTQAELRAGDCGARLAEVLRRGAGAGALLPWPGELFCTPLASAQVPIVPLPRRAEGGDVFGSLRPGGDPRLRELGITEARWVRVGSAHAVPSVALGDLHAGRVDAASVLSGRVAVVAFDEDDDRDLGPGSAAHTAARAAGLLEGGERRPAPWWLATLLGSAFVGVVALAQRRFGALRGALAMAAAAAILFGIQIALVCWWTQGLLPLASTFVGGVVAVAALVVPELTNLRRWTARANEMMGRAALFRVRGIDDTEGGAFFRRIASLAGQCHPAGMVLVAELPPSQWHLRFWPTATGTESVVGERRRDVRRTPYSDESGLFTIRVVRNFLVMKATPVVVVPLTALGDLEGHVFLCGDTAEAAFLEDPTRADRLAQELALLMRRRRLAAAPEEQTLYGVVAGETMRSHGLAELARSAEMVVEDMEMFGAVLREAPVGILHADAFGHVRLVAANLAGWLEAFGIAIPEGGLLAPGSLTLHRVIAALTGKSEAESSWWMTELMERPEGMSLTVAAPEAKGGGTLTLRARAVRRNERGADLIAGYVAVLLPAERAVVASGAKVVSLADADPLVAFSLAGALADVARAAARDAGRPVYFSPSRTQANVLGRRGRVLAALQAFLADAASLGEGRRPVATLRERPHRVEVALLDLSMGVPAAVLERVIEAPDAAPAGLESLARLVRAIEDSHGSVRLREGSGWGAALVVSLPRARPVVVDTPVHEEPKDRALLQARSARSA